MRQPIFYNRYGFMIAAVLMMMAYGASSAIAASAESKYYSAERCYRQLRNSPSLQKYRDRWFRCINKFLAVHKHDPRGQWASAGLYHAGVLYAELYRHSYYREDKKEALDIFDRVVRGYPKSRYRTRALQAKRDLLRGKGVSTAKAKPVKHTGSARSAYNRAKENYRKLQQNPKQKKYRDQWMRSIKNYQKAYDQDPGGDLAAAALYGVARCYDELHHYSRRDSDLSRAYTTYRKVIEEFPESAFADKAKTALPVEAGYARSMTTKDDEIAQVIKDANILAPGQDEQPSAATSSEPAKVHGLRFWSNPRYTRVVIDADKDTIFTYRELREDPDIGKPQRIYIDVHNSRLGKDLQKVVPINDNLLSDARAGQYTKDTVRVVVDIKSSKTFKIFSLKNPFRVVLDVWGEEKETAKQAIPPVGPKGKKLPPSAIVKQLALGVRRVVIDPGHGGKDYGAPGYLKGIHEKAVVLKIAKLLKQMLEDQVKCEVVLTRSKDRYLSLEERTAIANTQNADLFVSIHTNASRDRRAHGIETYILNLATDDEAIRVAAMENATSARNISDLDSILQDLMNNAKVNESTRLGSYVQQSMSSRLKRKFKNIRNKGIKQAPFYVLLGADMPSILIETSFISNPRECKRLLNKAYQKHMVQGIVDGIKRYIKETNPTALRPAAEGKVKG
ncbi:MAG: N-acetylmuramoyl-L-alanine amidase [Desulfobacteraceae bacterium]